MTDGPKSCVICGANLGANAALDACPRCVAARLLDPDPDPTPTASTVAAAPGAPIEKPGDRIGRYKLLEKIGEGGCGTVYVAEQTEPVRRRVALKVIKLGMDTRSVVARFEAERQALAMMDHPNIARVFDGGSTPTGRPYFVMELVRGMRITEYCDSNRLSTAQRIELFVRVCQAVQHAHQKGIIHRDLKPSNILVTINDGEPVPKVIDFGVAKAATGQMLTDKTVYTAFDQFIGTPAYMSPEQTLLTSLDIDTRSDIYSLGVLLYELLTGRLPFDPRQLLAAGFDEIRRTIREQEPQRPSARLRTLGSDELTTAAQRRSTDVQRLLHDVKGDLDWIVTRCLEKDRNRRYDSATSLGLDLQRHLRSQPISARPPSTIYTLQKLVRRNRLAFAAAGSVAVAVLAGLGVSTGLFLRERQTSRRAAQAEATAHSQASQARQAAEENRLQLRRLQISHGTRLMEEGDLLRSLAWFVAAFKTDRDHPGNEAAHQLRLASLLQQCPRPRQMLFFPGTPSFAVSPDKKTLLTATRDGQTALWDIDSGRRLALSPLKLEETAGTIRCRFAAEGGAAVVFDDEGSSPIVWSQLARTPQAQRIGVGEPSRDALLSPDGRFLVVCGRTSLLTVWDAANGDLLHELPGPTDRVDAMAFLPGSVTRTVFGLDTPAPSHVLIGVDRKGLIGLWDVASGRLLGQRRIEPVGGGAVVRYRGKFSPDGRFLLLSEGAAGIEPFACPLWNVAHGTLIARLKHEHHVHDIAFTPDGNRVVTSSQDKNVRIWDTRTGVLWRQPLVHPEAVHDIAISPGGHLLITATDEESTARLWNLDSGRPAGPPLLHAQKVRKVDFSIDDATTITACRDGTLRVWDLAAAPKWVWSGSLDSAEDVWFLNNPVETHFSASRGAALKHPRGLSILGVDQTEPRILDLPPGVVPIRAKASLDGRRVLVEFRPKGRGVFQLWSTETGRPAGPEFALKNGLGSLSESGDVGLLLAGGTGDEGGRVQLWSTTTGQPSGPRIAPAQSSTEKDKFRLSRDGLTVSAVQGRLLQAWNGTNGEARFAPVRLPAKVQQSDWSADGRHVAVACNGDSEAERFVQVFDLFTGQPASPRMAAGVGSDVVAFDSTGRRLVTGDSHQARVWEVATGRPLTPVMEAPAAFSTAAFTPDDRAVIGTSSEGTTRMWDAQTAEPLIAPLRHGDSVLVGWIEQKAALLLGQRLLHTFSTEPRSWEMPAETRPVEQWERLAQLLSARRLDPNGNLAPLDLESQSNLWSIVRQEAPSEFRASQERQYHWNVWRAEVAMASWDPRSALPHLDALVAVEPERIRFRSVRARALESQRDWAGAARDLRVATRLDPQNMYLWMRLAGVELATGNSSAYRAACERFARLASRELHRDAVKTALIVACMATNSPAVLETLLAAADEKERSDRWSERGLAEFRLGRYEKALALLHRDTRNKREVIFQAMTLQALGRSEEARARLEGARQQPNRHAAADQILSVGIPAIGDLNELLLQEAAGRIP